MISLSSFISHSSEYTLGPNDILTIAVPQDKTLSFDALEINKEGEVNLGYAGLIKISDLTVKSAEIKIKEKLEHDFLKQADVKIEVKIHGSKIVSLYGEVKKPGQIALKNNNALILDVISLAEGKTQLASDIVYIIRDYKNISPITIIKNRNNDIKTQNKNFKNENFSFYEVKQSDGFEVKPGDFIYIPPVFKVTVVGEVVKEGIYEFTEKPDIVMAIASAQGFKKTANKGNITIKRKTGTGVLNLKIDYNEFIYNNNKTFLLAHGDVVVVAESWF